MNRLHGILLAATAPLLLLAACARPAGDAAPVEPSDGGTSSAPNANELVVRTESYGGFVPASFTIGRIPEVSVYADGRVITTGPVPAIYPGPALPNVQVVTISQAKLQELREQGQAAGVRNGTDFGRPNVADAPTTRVTLGDQSVVVEALQQSQPDDPMLTAAQREARAKLSAYVKTLSDLPVSAGSASRPYAPEAVAVLARPWQKPADGMQSPQKAWPGPALPGTYVNPSFKVGCVVAADKDKDKVLVAAKDATAITPWTAGENKYLITFRPLLPDETGCAVLKGNRG